MIPFDFDGPICEVFAGLPAASVARRLERRLGERVESDDPLQILRESVRFGPEVVQAVEYDLVVAELEAIDSAVATPGGLESMAAGLAAGKVVGVLSNNSPQPIVEFLKAAGLLSGVQPIVGRAYANPSLMKPHPYPLQQALLTAQLKPAEVVFIGDSMADIEVALTGRVKSVAPAGEQAG